MTVYPEKAYAVMQALADRLNLDPYETAEGILTVLNNNMANAIRSLTIQKGYDPRDFTLVAFGGAGPLHAAEVAASMGIPEVLIPPYPGITAAMGLLTTDLRYDEIRNEFMLNVNVDLEKLNADLTALEHIVRQQLLTDGVPEADIKTERGADCRYVGQGYELRAYIPDGQVTADNIHVTWDSFHQIHKEEYGHRFLDHPIELVSLRVAGIGKMPKLRLSSIEAQGHDGSEGYLSSAEVYFRIDSKLEACETKYYERHQLKAGSDFPGPAVLFQMDTTTVVPPNWSVRVEPTGNLILKRER